MLQGQSRRRRSVGIDVGSTSIKGVCLEDGNLTCLASRPLPPAVAGEAGWHELDPTRVLAEVRDVLDAVASDGVDAIAFTGQMHGGVVTDARNRPVSSIVTWQDRRCTDLVREIRGRTQPSAWDGLGCDLQSGFLGATVAWFVERGFLPESGWRIHGIYEWLAGQLLGVDPYTDPSSAAAWGLYDIRRCNWNREALEACHVADAALPLLVESGDPVGRATLGKATGALVVSGVGDTQASFLGAGCASGDLGVNFGTGSQLLWLSDTFVRYAGTDVRPFFSRYLVTVPTLAGGAAYACLADFYADVLRVFGAGVPPRERLYQVMNHEAAVALCEGVVVSPFFNGSRTHGETLRASIGGLDARNFRPGNVTRALLTGLVEELAEPYFAISPPRRHSGLVGSGNGLRRNEVLRTIVAERFKLPLRMSPHEEEAAFGAARIAAGDVPRWADG